MTDATPKDRPVSWAVVTLVVIAALGVVLAIVLLASQGAIPDYQDDAATTKAAMTSWGTLALLVGAVAAIGAIVVAGVRSFLRRAGLPV